MNSLKSSRNNRPKRAKSGLRPYLPSFKSRPFLNFSLGFFLVIISLAIAAWAVDDARHEGKVARNVTVSGFDVGGLEPTGLAVVLENISSSYASTPVIISTMDGLIETQAGVVGIELDALATAKEVLSLGDGSFLAEPFRWVKSLFSSRPSDVVVYLRSGMSEEFKSLIISQQPDPIEPKWSVSNGTVVAISGISAKAFDLETIQYDVLEAARAGRNPIEVNATAIDIPPLISDTQAENFAKTINELTSSGLEVFVGDRNHIFSPQELRSWMSFQMVDGLSLIHI